VNSHAVSGGAEAGVATREKARTFAAFLGARQQTSGKEYAMREIRLNGGGVAKVDEEDFRWLKWFEWTRHVGNGGNVYAVCFSVGGKTPMHRAIIDAPKGMLVDHVNGDSLDNQKHNLRLATRSQNASNSKKANVKNGSSIYKGVSLASGHHREKRWRAMLCLGGKRQSLGYYKSEVEAAQAYDEAAKRLFGEFARTNF
jgi:hypothetical protein